MVEKISTYKYLAVIFAFTLVALSIYIQRRGLKKLDGEEREKADRILKNYMSIPFVLLVVVLVVGPSLGDNLKFILLYLAFVLLSVYKHIELRAAGLSGASLFRNVKIGMFSLASFGFLCVVLWSITVAT